MFVVDIGRKDLLVNSRTRSRSSTRSSDVGGLKLGVCFVEANREHSNDPEKTTGTVLRASSERDSTKRDDIAVDILKTDGERGIFLSTCDNCNGLCELGEEMNFEGGHE